MTNELGMRVGHWTDTAAATGCTAVVFDRPPTASAEVRGGAPASRELALLEPLRSVERIDAVLLTGGSAFGLAAADGVMRYCEEAGRGVPTPAGRVPIVPALGLYDLLVGDASVRPGPEEGYRAASGATSEITAGRIGAGTGATVGKAGGAPEPGGLGAHTVRVGELVVTALVAVNAVGWIDVDGTRSATVLDTPPPAGALFGNTTIGVVATNATLDKLGCLWVAQGAHDGLARSIVPPHTRADGDAFVATASGDVTADPDTVRMAALRAVEQAIRSVAT